MASSTIRAEARAMTTAIDPSPLFALSLLPYLLFLRWVGRCQSVPPLAKWGFRLTLLFVIVTVAAAILAMRLSGGELVDVDWLHGGAEAFLTLSNALVVLGFAQRIRAFKMNNS
ncbi:hypothetical protein OMCYN_01341 [cyanobiont of Ornithocercus magnificus]|nr:hypothetical protein OMCYN_01341 [cyanobiont of Ornithocercus magnificus]